RAHHRKLNEILRLGQISHPGRQPAVSPSGERRKHACEQAFPSSGVTATDALQQPRCVLERRVLRARGGGGRTLETGHGADHGTATASSSSPRAPHGATIVAPPRTGSTLRI